MVLTLSKQFMAMAIPFKKIKIKHHLPVLDYYLTALLALIIITVSCCFLLSQYSPYLVITLLAVTLVCGLALFLCPRPSYIFIATLILIVAVLLSSRIIGVDNPITLLLLTDSLIYIYIFFPSVLTWTCLPLAILMIVFSPTLINPFKLKTLPLKRDWFTILTCAGLILLGLSLVDWLKRKTESWQKARSLTKFSHNGSILAHELNNPLTATLLELDKVEKKLAPDKTKSISCIARNLKLIKEIIKCFRQPRQKYKLETFSVAVTIKLALNMLQYKADEAQVKLKYLNHSHSTIKIRGRSCLLYQVISNLITNSIEAYTQSNPRQNCNNLKQLILIETNLNSEKIIITLEDWGPGLKKTSRTKFQEFGFDRNQCAGLGLIISRKIVRQHFSGEIKFCPKKQGVKITIKLPTL